MKHVIIVLFALLLAFISSYALAENAENDETDTEVRQEIESEIENQLDDVDIQSWDEMLSELPDDVKAIWDNKSAEELVEEYALGESGFVLGDIFDGSFDILKNEFASRIGFIVKLLILAVLMGILTNAGASLGKGISDIGGFVCYCLMAVIIAADFASMVSYAQSTITSINSFMQKVFPVLLTLLTALGGSASAGIFQPAMALLSGTVGTVVCGVVLPIILAMGMLAVISNMTERAPLTQLYGLGKTTSKWILGFTFTMFFAVMSLQGITAASFDGISVRTAKFMIDKFVPIVG
jgi:stage III sporulation protein AE